MQNFNWKAVYDDDTKLSQFNSDGSENKYTDIDRSKLVQFVLSFDTVPKLVIHLDKSKRLIYRRRVAMNSGGIIQVVWLAGWQEKRNGINVQSVSFLFEDGHVEVVDGFKENHSWFYSINFLEEEKV